MTDLLSGLEVLRELNLAHAPSSDCFAKCPLSRGRGDGRPSLWPRSQRSSIGCMRRGITGSSSSRCHHCSCWVCSRHVDAVSVVDVVDIIAVIGRPRSRPTMDASRIRTVRRRGGLPRPVSGRAASGRARTRRRCSGRLRLVVVPSSAAGGARVAAASAAAAGLLRVGPRAGATVRRAVVRAAAGTQRPGRRAGVCWRAAVGRRRADCGGRRGGCGRHGDGRLSGVRESERARPAEQQTEVETGLEKPVHQLSQRPSPAAFVLVFLFLSFFLRLLRLLRVSGWRCWSSGGRPSGRGGQR